jgi:hypothetical protein
MAIVRNKPFIDKCIISFSHDRHPSRLEADRMALAKARREIATGKKGVSHLILRAADDDIDRLKFLFLIDGIPLMCYSLANLLFSSLKEIVVVGSQEVKQVQEAFLAVVGTRGKTIRFIEEEGARPSLLNTLERGRSLLTLDDNELVLFQPGDLPFLYDLEKVLKDDAIKSHNLILWLNSRQAMFPRFKEDPDSEFVQRNYHYRALYNAARDLHDIKEPNVYPLNLHVLDPGIMESLHLKRKDGRILMAGVRKALAVPLRLLRLMPVILYHLNHFKADLHRLRSGDSYQFGAHDKTFHKGVSILLNTPFTTRLHDDPAFVSDVDALEDWEDFEALAHYARRADPERSLAAIHPMGRDLFRFREEGMPALKKELPLYRDFPAHLNAIFRSLEMDHVPFDADGRYTSPEADTPRLAHAYRWYEEKCRKLNQAGASRL